MLNFAGPVTRAARHHNMHAWELDGAGCEDAATIIPRSGCMVAGHHGLLAAVGEMTTPETDSEDDRPPGFRDDYSASGGLWLTPSAKRLFRKRRLMPASPCTCQTLTIATVANTWRTPPPTMEVATMVVGIRGDGRASWSCRLVL